MPPTTLRKTPFPTLIPFTKTRLCEEEAARVRELGLDQVEYSCSTDRGLRAVIYASAEVSMYSRYSYLNRPQRMPLGKLGLITLEQARQRHRAIRVLAAQGIDPRAPPRTTLLYCDLHKQDYLVQCRSRGKKSIHTDISRYTNWIGPEFGHLPVADITKTHISRFVIKMQEAGLAPATVKSTISQLHATLEIAVDTEVIARNPAKGLRLPPPNNRREEFLTVVQMQSLLLAAKTSEQLVGSRMIMLLALTGARLGEATNAQWDHIDLDEGIWYLPTQKSNRPDWIFLSEPAKTVVRELAAVRRNQFLFPGERGNDQLSRPIKLFRRLCKQAGIPSHFRIHDCRHAYVSAGIYAGIPLEIMSFGARHRSPTTTRIYSHPHRQSLVAANEKIAAMIMPLEAALAPSAP